MNLSSKVEDLYFMGTQVVLKTKTDWALGPSTRDHRDQATQALATTCHALYSS